MIELVSWRNTKQLRYDQRLSKATRCLPSYAYARPFIFHFPIVLVFENNDFMRLFVLQVANELELLDSPGIIPARQEDQNQALKLAICNDIGQASYDTQVRRHFVFSWASRSPEAHASQW